MSMINDALRRARDGKPAAAPPMPAPQAAPLPPPPLPPAISSRAPVSFVPPPPPMPDLPDAEDVLPPAPPIINEPPRKSSRSQLVLGFALVVCVGIAAAVTFWANKMHAAKVVQQALGAKKIIAPEKIPTTPVVAAQPTPTPAVPSNSSPVAASNAAKVVKPTVVVVTTSAVPATPVKFPPLRLQSIFYRPANPSVLINGKTLFLGDEIQGVAVADISPSSVTLVLSGQTNVLTLR